MARLEKNESKSKTLLVAYNQNVLLLDLTAKKKMKQRHWRQIHSVQLLTWVEWKDKGLGCVFLGDAMPWHDAGSSLDIPR